MIGPEDQEFAADPAEGLVTIESPELPNINTATIFQLNELVAPRGTGKTIRMVLSLFEAIEKPEVTEALVVVANPAKAEEIIECIEHVYDEAQGVLDDAGESKEGREVGPRRERADLVLFRGAHIFIVAINDLERAERGMPSGTPRFVDHFALQCELGRLLRPTL